MILKGDKPEPGKEYLIAIRAELSEISKDIKEPENPVYTYTMEYLVTESVMEIGSKKTLAVQKGKTPSQKLRFVIQDVARIQGVDEDVFYEQEMSNLINNYVEKLK